MPKAPSSARAAPLGDTFGLEAELPPQAGAGSAWRPAYNATADDPDPSLGGGLPQSRLPGPELTPPSQGSSDFDPYADTLPARQPLAKQRSGQGGARPLLQQQQSDVGRQGDNYRKQQQMPPPALYPEDDLGLGGGPMRAG